MMADTEDQTRASNTSSICNAGEEFRHVSCERAIGRPSSQAGVAPGAGSQARVPVRARLRGVHARGRYGTRAFAFPIRPLFHLCKKGIKRDDEDFLVGTPRDELGSITHELPVALRIEPDRHRNGLLSPLREHCSRRVLSPMRWRSHGPGLALTSPQRGLVRRNFSLRHGYVSPSAFPQAHMYVMSSRRHRVGCL